MHQTEYERYKTAIYRIGWRVQYRAKTMKRKECPFDLEIFAVNFTEASDNKIMLNQLIKELPPEGQRIIQKIYFEGLTESEVAKDLGITQQAVNKWKRKLNNLSQKKNLKA